LKAATEVLLVKDFLSFHFVIVKEVCQRLKNVAFC